MRIVKSGVHKIQNIQQFKCQICGCVYELNLCDEEIGECPCCHAHKGYQVKCDDVELNMKQEEKLKTPDEVYPEKFYSFKDGLDKSDKEIRELIRETIEHYKQNNCGYSMCATGRVLVAVFQSDKDNIDDYQVIVTKDYSSLDSMELDEE